MKRRRLISLACLVVLPSFAAARSQDPRSFETQVKNGVRLLNEWRYLKQGEDGLWQKQWLLVESTKYDVVKSDSVLRPIVGTLQASVVCMFSIKHAARADAEADKAIEDAPNVPGGKNAYTLEYDLRFEPAEVGWSFLEGKARTSMQLILGRNNWTELSASNLRESGGMHGPVIRAFGRRDSPMKKPSQKRLMTKNEA